MRARARASQGAAPSDPHHAQLQRRRESAARLLGPGPAAARIDRAPAGYLLAHGPSDIARHCALLTPVPVVGDVRVVMTPGRVAHEWRLDIAARDQPGLLASFTHVLAAAGIDVVQAVLATWSDNAALEAFIVRAATMPAVDDLEARLQASIGMSLSSLPIPDADVSFGDAESALYTPCTVRAPDRRGLLHDIALAIAASGSDVHAARVTTADGTAHDHFDLSDSSGQRLTVEAQAAIRTAVVQGAGPGRFRRSVPTFA